jgi:hypothetical protein
MSDEDIVFVLDVPNKKKRARKSNDEVQVTKGVKGAQGRKRTSKKPKRDVSIDFDFSNGKAIEKGKRKGKKKPKRLPEDKSLKENDLEVPEGSVQIVTPRYRVFFPFGRIDNCEVIGTDIGKCNILFHFKEIRNIKSCIYGCWTTSFKRRLACSLCSWINRCFK